MSKPSPPPELFEEIRRRHGHYCPMSTLGGRLGFAARQRLAPAGELTAVYFSATCAIDGIRVSTGCDPANGTLRVTERNRHALWLATTDGRGVLVELLPAALERAGEYRTLDLALESERAHLSPDLLARRLGEKENFLRALLQQLRSLPDDELLALDDRLPASLT